MQPRPHRLAALADAIGRDRPPAPAHPGGGGLSHDPPLKFLSPPASILVRVVAPHFVAGLVVEGDRCVDAAPILRWAIGRDRDGLRAYFARKGWRASVVSSAD